MSANAATTTPDRADATVIVDVALRAGPVTLVGQTTAVPGLVITPTVTGTPAHFTGGWSLTHQASGLLVVPGLYDVPLIYTREGVQALRPAAIDWTAPARQLAADQAARDAAARVIAMVLTALAEHAPLWWALDSVHHCDDGWALRCAAPLCRADLPGDQPEWLCGYDEDDGRLYRLRVADPDRLAAPATRAGWRAHGAHWLCPACADAHPVSHQDHDGC